MNEHGTITYQSIIKNGTVYAFIHLILFFFEIVHPLNELLKLISLEKIIPIIFNSQRFHSFIEI